MSIVNIEEQAIPFLAQLENCALDEAWDRSQTFLTVDEDQQRKDPALTVTLHAPLSSVASLLVSLNNAGAGIYVGVNRTDLHGRKKENVIGIRGWHVDIDWKLQANYMTLGRLPLIPTMRISSGGGGCHLYWLSTSEMPCVGDEQRRIGHEAELRAITSSLRLVGADHAATDISRTLRLAGTRNNKVGRGDIARIDMITPHRYERDQIQQAFPLPQIQRSPLSGSNAYVQSYLNSYERARGYLSKVEGAVQGELGSIKTYNTALKLFSKFGLNKETVLRLMTTDYNPRCVPPWDEKDLLRTVERAEEMAVPMPLEPIAVIPSPFGGRQR